MKITDIKPPAKFKISESRKYLYEGLDNSSCASVMLWESAGNTIVEYKLTSQQINQIFQQAEQGMSDQGANRTLVGKAKDAGEMGVEAAKKVNKAWEDLKTKISNSKPVKDFDQKMSDVLSKIGMGAKDPQFQGLVSNWVQKYRDFAQKHPIIQGAVYATAVALAGLSGAGATGAAALGLIRMADKVLQGERFSSAAYAGARTGAIAGAAGAIGNAVHGHNAAAAAGTTTPDQMSLPDADAAMNQQADVQAAQDWINADDAGKAQIEQTTGMPAAQLQDIAVQNDLTPNTGEVPTADSLSPGEQTDTASGWDDGTAADGTDLNSYTVMKGETLSSIAQAHGVSVADLMGLNPDITNPDVIQAGQTINIPPANGSDIYAGGTGTASDTANNIARGNYTDSPISHRGATQAASAATQLQTGAGAVPSGAQMSPDYLQQVVSGQHPRPMISADDAQKALDWQAQNGGQAATAAANTASNGFSKEYLQQVLNGEHPRPMISKEKAAELLNKMNTVPYDQFGDTDTLNVYGPGGVDVDKTAAARAASRAADRVIAKESYVDSRQTARTWLLRESLGRKRGGVVITEAGINAVFEGVMDWLKQKGKNITTKVTADKLKKAWTKAGMPNDSEAIEKMLVTAGVGQSVVFDIFDSLGIPTTDKTGAPLPKQGLLGKAAGAVGSAIGGVRGTFAGAHDAYAGGKSTGYDSSRSYQAGAHYGASGVESPYSKKVQQVADKVEQRWETTVASSGVEPTPERAVEFMQQMTGVMPTSQPANMSPEEIKSWIGQQVDSYMKTKAPAAQKAAEPAKAPKAAKPVATHTMYDKGGNAYNYNKGKDGKWRDAQGGEVNPEVAATMDAQVAQNQQAAATQAQSQVANTAIDAISTGKRARAAQTARAGMIAKAGPATKPAAATNEPNRFINTMPDQYRAHGAGTVAPKKSLLAFPQDKATPATATATPAQQPVAAKAHTGGKVAGQLSQTPGAIKKRQQRATKAGKTAAQPALAAPNFGGQFGGYSSQTMGTPTFKGPAKQAVRQPAIAESRIDLAEALWKTIK